eukprot:CAMPEP_0185156010 /NCGR_PEP_ID=MMETSP1139-20130426/817_1 /TAXON_ID=298111 /ORGANISM="Pavlova sp., Strain CCMP459" /LENGTH=151 /DNA_ID=CAMNT_0027720957 /DNA_START=42 /DNA_END=498 /DNA_ORIENTATION=+
MAAAGREEDCHVLITVDERDEGLLSKPGVEYDIEGIDTAHPVLTIAGREFVGTYKEDTSALLFAPESGSTPDAMRIASPYVYSALQLSGSTSLHGGLVMVSEKTPERAAMCMNHSCVYAVGPCAHRCMLIVTQRGSSPPADGDRTCKRRVT